MTPETSQSGDSLSNQLDRLEAVAARKDLELANLRAEVELKDQLIREMQAALGCQETMLGQLAGRIDEMEQRLSAPRLGPR